MLDCVAVGSMGSGMVMDTESVEDKEVRVVVGQLQLQVCSLTATWWSRPGPSMSNSPQFLQRKQHRGICLAGARLMPRLRR